MRTDRFVERGLSYDGNGNLLTLQRTENGAVANDFSYTYDGNRLISLTDGSMSYAYAYDPNGNLTRDGIHDLDLSYNKLNLIEKVSRDGVTLANYSYLSDGTKLSATNASGDGLVYIGSLVYRKRNGVLSLESAGFNGGRFVATNTGIEPRYFLTDHLGSTRVVVNNFGEVLERNDYHAYGKRWTDANSLLSDNRYGYNGKEKQDFVSLPYIDYGARQYDPIAGMRWNGLDQLSENYYSTSPFVFCAGNPIRNVDVDGRKIYFALGVSQEFKSKFARTVQYMNQCGTAGNLAALEKSERIYYINEARSIQETNFNPVTNTINWDPNHLLETTDHVLLSPATTLAHEADHAQKYDEVLHGGDEVKLQYNESVQNGSDAQYEKTEERRVITGTEQLSAQRHGDINKDQVTRTNHKGKQSNLNILQMNPEEISDYIYDAHNQYIIP